MNTKKSCLLRFLTRFFKITAGHKFIFTHKPAITAFTLAEVLITLAIIGIVAALIMPVIINQYEKRVTVTRLQKTASELHQAFDMAIAEHGNGSRAELEISYDTYQGPRDIYNYIKPYMKISKECDEDDESCFTRFVSNNNLETAFNTNFKLRKLKSFITNSGVSVALWTHGEGMRSGFVIVDLNGPTKGPAKLGQDVMVIGWDLDDEKNLTRVTGGTTYFPSEDYSREELLDACKSEGAACSTLIKNDGWKISDDYPWRTK